MTHMTLPMTTRQPSRFFAILRNFFSTARVETDYQRTRRELEALDDRTLADIGISRGMIEDIARAAMEMSADHKRI